MLKKRYYERKTFARKERDDVFGGANAWDNADKTKVQCPVEGCDGAEAAFFQVQIRSADEPMTSFYKVCWEGREFGEKVLTFWAVYDLWEQMERELRFLQWSRRQY